MRIAFLALCLVPLPLMAEVRGANYPKVLANFKAVHCDFVTAKNKALPLNSLDLKRIDATQEIVWFQDNTLPQPILSGMRMPQGDTSFYAAGTDRALSMLSYLDNGEAFLSRHMRDDQGSMRWTTQSGICREDKGE